MIYYTIEHASRGCLISKNPIKCSYSILRSDPKIIKFFTKDEAIQYVKQIKNSYLLEWDTSKKPGKFVTKITLKRGQ